MKPPKSLSERDLAALVPQLKELLYAQRQQREILQQHGVNVTPVNFYASIPSLREVLESFEYTETTPPYLNRALFEEPRLADELQRLVPHSADFDPPVAGDEERCNAFFWGNSQFSFSDAMSYFAYLRQLAPRRVVEIGSGFSSLVAVDALQRNGTGELICVEPYPRPFLERLHAEGRLQLQKVRAQDLTPAHLDSLLADGDVLFVDSTHTVKSGSDCLHIYLRLLPSLTKRVLVHVHDVFLPFGLPQAWLLDLQIHWTEQYLLLAFLTDNPRTTVKFGSAYHDRFNPETLDALMRGRCRRGGGSFWFEYDGRR